MNAFWAEVVSAAPTAPGKSRAVPIAPASVALADSSASGGMPARPIADHVAVDRDADAAEDGDAERAAELGAGLRDGRRRARALGRRGADDQVGRRA